MKKDFINEKKYYHGTPYKSAVENIKKHGLGGNNVEKLVNGGVGEGFESADGRSYITKNKGNAFRYASFMSGDEDYVYVLEFDVDDDDLGLDEDEVGHVIYRYLNGKCELPFRKTLLKYFTKEELYGIKKGSFSSFASCKKILDRLTKDEIKQMLSLPETRNATTHKNVKPTAQWSVKRPNKEIRDEIMKRARTNPDIFTDYFEKHKKRVKM